MDKEVCDCSWCKTGLSKEELDQKISAWSREALVLLLKHLFPEQVATKAKEMQAFAAFIDNAVCAAATEDDFDRRGIATYLHREFVPDAVELVFKYGDILDYLENIGKMAISDRRSVVSPIMTGIYTPQDFFATLIHGAESPPAVYELLGIPQSYAANKDVKKLH